MNLGSSLVPSGFPGVNLHLGDHICHFYHGKEHLLTKIVPFIEAGLVNREKCLVYLDQEVKIGFKRLMGDKESLAVKNWSLDYLDIDCVVELYAAGTEKQLEDFFAQAVEEACRSGFSSVRICGQTGLFLNRLTEDRLLFLEKLTGTIISKLPAVALCEYPFNPEQTTEFAFLLNQLHTYYLSGGRLFKDNRQFRLVKKERENYQQKKN